MKYYRELDISNYDIIVKKCLIFVKTNPVIFLRKVETASYYHLDVDRLLKMCPELIDAFLEFDLHVNYAAVYVMYSPAHTAPHKDDFPQQARINIPLLNCTGTFTAFYKNAGTAMTIHPDLKVPRFYVTNTDYEIADKVEIKKTTVLRISEVHNILMPDQNPIPRINLSIGFKEYPVFLLE